MEIELKESTARLLLYCLIGFWLTILIGSFFIGGRANAQAGDPVFSYTSADDCFEGVLDWPQQAFDDGNTLLQIRYYNYTTGGYVLERGAMDYVTRFLDTEEPQSIDTSLLDWTVGACGNGLWSYQLRWGRDDDGTWLDWEEYVVIHITDYVGVPEAPYIVSVTDRGWSYAPE